MSVYGWTEIGRWSYRVYLFTVALVFTGSTAIWTYGQNGLVAAIGFIVILWAAECLAYDLVLRHQGRR
jgi:hypothetical protein